MQYSLNLISNELVIILIITLKHVAHNINFPAVHVVG
jgi:hypothetical protein